MLNLISIGAGGIVAFISLVLLRLLTTKDKISHFSIKLFIITFILIYGGIISVAQTFNDVIVVCFPVVVLAILEKAAIVYLARFLNNDKTSIIKLFIILSYFTGLIVAKYLM